MSAEWTAGLVRVIAPEGSTGTGFVVSDDGLMVTCSHVVQSESSQRAGEPRPETVTVVLHIDGSSHTASVVPEWWRSCDAEDVAFLRVSDPLPMGVKPLKLGPAKISRGHEFYSRGYRLADQFAQGLDAEGRIQSLTTHNQQATLQLLTNQIDQGMSGAPIFDTQTQRVVGMANFFWETTRHIDGWLAGAVPAETLKAICGALILHPPQAIEDYLAAVREYCANLPYLTLHDIRPPKTLDEVYVPLKARPQPRKDENKPKDEQERLEREALRLEPLSIAEVMQSRDAPHVLILGEPGAGKSTLLRQMAERAWDAPQAIGLSEPHLPLLVPLRQLVLVHGSLDERLSAALGNEKSLPLRFNFPSSFLNEWSLQTGAGWLILLDALDEVPDGNQRSDLISWLKGQIPHLRNCRVVITTRPAGYKDDFDAQIFSHYDLLSFSSQQAIEFARKWFNNKADTFLNELGRIRTSDLRGTPLLLTIAAKVFSERGTLPGRLSILYEEFIIRLLKEASQRDERPELSERLWDVAFFILARLALAVSEQPENAPEQASLSHVAANYLISELGFKRDEAEVNGRKLLAVLARRSAVFTQRDDSFQFAHSTFREYLAAYEVVRSCKDFECLWLRAISRWEDSNWRETSLFALAILNDRKINVTPLVERIWQSRTTKSLHFVGIILADGVEVDAELSDKLINGLVNAGREKFSFWRELDEGFLTWRYQFEPLAILAELHSYPRAGEGLLAIASDDEIYWRETRAEAAIAWGRWGNAYKAKHVLRKACEYNGGGHDYFWLLEAKGLAALGLFNESAYYLLSNLEFLDEEEEEENRSSALEMLSEYCSRNEGADFLIELACNAKASRKDHSPEFCNTIARVLNECGRADQAANIWLAFAADARANLRNRQSAADALGRLGRMDEAAEAWLAIERDGGEVTWTLRDAVESLIQLGRMNEAVQALLAFASARNIDSEQCQFALEELTKLGQADEAIQAWLVLASNKHADAWVRLHAIDALWNQGYRDRSVQVLLDMANDTTVIPEPRARAIQKISNVDDEHVVVNLRQIAESDLSEHVRTAAREAAEQIRARLANQSS